MFLALIKIILRLDYFSISLIIIGTTEFFEGLLFFFFYIWVYIPSISSFSRCDVLWLKVLGCILWLLKLLLYCFPHMNVVLLALGHAVHFVDFSWFSFVIRE